MFRPQTRNIQYFKEGLVCFFVGVFGEKFALFCTETLPVKKNETDIKCITWGVTNSRMLNGKADGYSQWFLSRLASEKPTAHRVVSLSFGVGETNCSQGSFPHALSLKQSLL